MNLLDCHTLREILHQPKMWDETFDLVNSQREALGAFRTREEVERTAWERFGKTLD